MTQSKKIRSDQISQSVVSDSLRPHESGLPVHHQLAEFTQTHVHQVSDATDASALYMAWYSEELQTLRICRLSVRKSNQLGNLLLSLLNLWM